MKNIRTYILPVLCAICTVFTVVKVVTLSIEKLNGGNPDMTMWLILNFYWAAYWIFIIVQTIKFNKTHKNKEETNESKH